MGACSVSIPDVSFYSCWETVDSVTLPSTLESDRMHSFIDCLNLFIHLTLSTFWKSGGDTENWSALGKRRLKIRQEVREEMGFRLDLDETNHREIRSSEVLWKLAKQIRASEFSS